MNQHLTNPILFAIVVVSTLMILLVWFIIKRYQVVENNELLIIESWLPMRKKLRFISGGTTFVLPLFEKFTRKSLEPMELNIDLNRVMTKGNIPLGGKIFAQVVIDDSSDAILQNVAKHLGERTRAQQIDAIFEILNGVLRETVATLTPEQVLEDKEQFKEEMLKNAVVSLAHMGFKIKTLNIQEVSDMGNDANGYISQLMRPRAYYVKKDTRIEVSNAESNKVLEQNEAHKKMKLKQVGEAIKSLEAEMNYKIEQAVIEGEVKSQEIAAALSAEYQEVLASLETKKAELEAMVNRFEADNIQKAEAKKDQLIEEGKAKAAKILKAGEAEVTVLEEQLTILEKSGKEGMKGFLIDNLEQLSNIFTETMESAKAKELNIIEGLSNNNSSSHPLSAQNVAVLLEILKTSGLDITDVKNYLLHKQAT